MYLIIEWEERNYISKTSLQAVESGNTGWILPHYLLNWQYVLAAETCLAYWLILHFFRHNNRLISLFISKEHCFTYYHLREICSRMLNSMYILSSASSFPVLIPEPFSCLLPASKVASEVAVLLKFHEKYGSFQDIASWNPMPWQQTVICILPPCKILEAIHL